MSSVLGLTVRMNDTLEYISVYLQARTGYVRVRLYIQRISVHTSRHYVTPRGLKAAQTSGHLVVPPAMVSDLSQNTQLQT